ncbi:MULTISPECIES: preprotein translocase subunit YajC [unclassified Salinibacterium]|uniref:preprotein translocase subunit YajC n=1 Tax=unclassified Salinibacterium TaxID=2632331 RepID=UPI0018CE4DB0|nr:MULTISPECIES: preprotein translocase subunit YajC [unclassified Salinibacterium]MBH0054115.1 preprotein translocase subunit YajC [Salinibacterium sp. SWN139]MBH0083401.1 preprotein translocase subunit YajC [Salinibacterium sp. SWN167]
MDPLSIAMLAILGVLIFFMFRNSRKRKAQMEELREQMVPGVEVMTNFGLFGTLITMDTVKNEAEIEISKGVIVKVHSQTLAKVVAEDAVEDGAPRSVEEAMEIANREAEEREAAGEAAVSETDPEFGELSDSKDDKSSK